MNEKTEKLPRGAIKTADDVLVKASPKLVRLAMAGYGINQQIKQLGSDLKAINQQIEQLGGVGNTVIVDSIVQVPIAERETIRINDPDALREGLGPRFDDLVNSRTSYSPTDKLKEIIADGDDVLGKAVREYVSINHSVSVSYRGGKALPPGKLPKAAPAEPVTEAA